MNWFAAHPIKRITSTIQNQIPFSGGMPDVMYYTRRRYYSGIVGCISEIVLAGELRLSLDPETLGTAHNVEPGIF